MFVLDTNIVSRLMRRDVGVLNHVRGLRPDELFLTSPVAAEIRYGLELLPATSKRRRLLEREYARLRDAIQWADWTEDAAAEFGRQKARLKRGGRLIEDMDIAIAAIAIVLGAQVATSNARHFERIKDLVVSDWNRFV